MLTWARADAANLGIALRTAQHLLAAAAHARAQRIAVVRQQQKICGTGGAPLDGVTACTPGQQNWVSDRIHLEDTSNATFRSYW